MKRDFSKITWVMIVLLMISSLTLINCSRSSTTTKPVTTQKPAATTTAKPITSATTALTPKSGGILKVDPRNPAQRFGYSGDFAQPNGLECSYPCAESICDVDQKGNFLPGLATAYEVAPDGKSITFTLRKGVKFHDGSDFNAQAVKWNLELMKKGRFVGTESWASNPAVDVIDDYTARLNLKLYTNTLIYQFASTSRMISPTGVEKNGEDWAHTHPVGTGPFKFESFTPDVGIKYARNDDYWGGKPYLDGIEYVFIKNDMAKAAALQSGAVDMLFNVTPETAISLRDKGYYVDFSNPTLIGIVPDSANADSPLSNIKVRQAIEYAIDRNALKELGNGFWEAANQPCTPNAPGYIANFEGRKYDPEKARQLLAEAGYANGFNAKLIFNQSNLQPPDAMVAVQQFLGKVGITVDVQQTPSAQRTTLSKEGWKNGFIAFSVYGGLGFISGLQYNLGGDLFISNTRPPDFIDLVTQAAAATDAAASEELTRKIVQSLHNNAAVIPLWIAPQSVYAEQTYVHDVGIYEGGGTADWTPAKAWLNK
jgi:peptide/nickel transport system substrate-binding protein